MHTTKNPMEPYRYGTLSTQVRQAFLTPIITPYSNSSVFPPKEADALFVTTNFLLSPKQYRGICDGTAPDEDCDKNSQCVNMTVTTNGRFFRREISKNFLKVSIVENVIKHQENVKFMLGVLQKLIHLILLHLIIYMELKILQFLLEQPSNFQR